MEKKKVLKKLLAGIMVVATVAFSSKVTGLVTDNRGAVAEAAGRPVSITSCLIQGDNVVVNVSTNSVPSAS